MATTVVRYRTRPDRAEENQRLIEAVFVELAEREPEGFTYKVFRLVDGVSFIHIVIEHDINEPDSLQDMPAFQAFVAGIGDRCDEPPVATGVSGFIADNPTQRPQVVATVHRELRHRACVPSIGALRRPAPARARTLASPLRSGHALEGVRVGWL